MKTPTRRSKRVDEESEPNVATPRVVLRTRKAKCSKTRAVRVKPEYPLAPSTSEMKLMPPEFFQIDSLDLAPRLLGKFLRRDNVVLRITEVEAYRPNDSACHGRFGVTPRTAPVEGVGAAVLIRSCSPVTGLETIQERRGLKTEKPVLLNGPGKVGQALGLSTEWSHHPLYSPGGLELLDGGEDVEKIVVGPRVGIDYALPQHVHALWRFAIADTPWISAPKNTLKPL
ncbi:DNA-3-methyladenine glycosylase isoform X2 [Capsella rubella]|uniref:DNA-3-methyladenine glycosylase isoform X2 n=1 Tax=Capsella rubella TaxID=81985 RepID=UPI000CD4FEA2|nr:DNA-3-methyladenine glycosylase isoform X2 [Capsella rubella]